VKEAPGALPGRQGVYLDWTRCWGRETSYPILFFGARRARETVTRLADRCGVACVRLQWA